jgi:phage shock protein A
VGCAYLKRREIEKQMRDVDSLKVLIESTEQKYQSMKTRAKELEKENDSLTKRISELEDQVKFLGSNAFGD